MVSGYQGIIILLLKVHSWRLQLFLDSSKDLRLMITGSSSMEMYMKWSRNEQTLTLQWLFHYLLIYIYIYYKWAVSCGPFGTVLCLLLILSAPHFLHFLSRKIRTWAEGIINNFHCLRFVRIQWNLPRRDYVSVSFFHIRKHQLSLEDITF